MTTCCTVWACSMASETATRNALRAVGYVPYDFFSTETGYFLLGTAPGKKKILAVDVGFDKQSSYRS
jgi:hypothetical protein